jgi:hypothetical protein
LSTAIDTLPVHIPSSATRELCTGKFGRVKPKYTSTCKADGGGGGGAGVSFTSEIEWQLPPPSCEYPVTVTAGDSAHSKLNNANDANNDDNNCLRLPSVITM